MLRVFKNELRGFQEKRIVYAISTAPVQVNTFQRHTNTLHLVFIIVVIFSILLVLPLKISNVFLIHDD